MYMLLLFVVLLAVLLSPVAASSPIMELTPPGSPLAQPLLDIDELFMCQFCRMQYELCWCMPQMPQYDSTPFIPDYGLVDTPLPQPRETEVDLTPVHDYVTGHARPLLNDEYMQYMDDNETTVQPNTVLVHIGETYTPGDRSSSHLPKPKKRPHRRQAPRNRGFVCNQAGCNEAFNRQCDLNRHQRTTHLSERPHVCPTCNKGFLYPKDLRRHERRHSDPSSPMDTFHCEHPDCTNLAGFSRKDNLMRHKRNQHQEQ